MHLSTLPFLLLASVSVHAHNPPHRRHLAKTPRYVPVIARAGGVISNDTLASISAAEEWSSTHFTSTESASITSTSSEAEQSGQVGDTIAPEITSSSSSSSISSISTTAAAASGEYSQIVAPSSISSAAPTSTPSSVDNAPSTIVPPSTINVVSSITTSQKAYTSVITQTRTASTSASIANANDTSEEKKSGLSKTALIVIIVVASVVGLGALAVFAIRKWKLGKSSRFDDRMKPIDFSPSGNDGMEDVFLEKTLHRTLSNDMADKQRQQFVKELEADPSYIAGIPEHDFTANPNHAGYGATGYADDMYNSDPFAHAQAYEYDESAYYAHPVSGDYPPASAGQVDFPVHPGTDYPTQDTGYADLQRGNSNGSDHRPLSGSYGGRVSPGDFPTADQYIGRPTGGSDGPYAQAAQYRY